VSSETRGTVFSLNTAADDMSTPVKIVDRSLSAVADAQETETTLLSADDVGDAGGSWRNWIAGQLRACLYR